MKIINARLRQQEALYTLDLQDGVIKSITAQAAAQAASSMSAERIGVARTSSEPLFITRAV